MIVTRIEALGFRSLRYVSQPLGPFHVLVGPNASGKSAFLDVLAFLGDLQRVGVQQAIAGSEAQDVSLRAVDPQHLTWMRRRRTFELAVGNCSR
ncbi:MAG: AAA family ATPase [Acidobacteriota bacterium]|nr:AAA family ATPase [Acidobacteriota bacterium]